MSEIMTIPEAEQKLNLKFKGAGWYGKNIILPLDRSHKDTWNPNYNNSERFKVFFEPSYSSFSIIPAPVRDAA